MRKIQLWITVFICLAVICAAAFWVIWRRSSAAPHLPATGANTDAGASAYAPQFTPIKPAPAVPAPKAAPAAANAEQQLHGEAVYDARAALPPQAALDISLSETEADGRSGKIIAQTHKLLSGRSPLEWVLPIKVSALDNHKTYAMQAKISSGDSLLFVNAAPTAIDSHRTAYIIRLAKIDSGIAPAETHSLTGTSWQAISLLNKNIAAGAEISLSFDGSGKADPVSAIKTYQVSGSSGCNHYAATADLDEKAKSLQFSPLGASLIACLPALAAQEADFIVIMAKVRSYKIDESGILLLLDGEQNTLARFIAH